MRPDRRVTRRWMCRSARGACWDLTRHADPPPESAAAHVNWRAVDDLPAGGVLGGHMSEGVSGCPVVTTHVARSEGDRMSKPFSVEATRDSVDERIDDVAAKGISGCWLQPVGNDPGVRADSRVRRSSRLVESSLAMCTAGRWIWPA
jgi:hypothetical protein